MAAAASADWQPNLRHIKVWDLASEEQITVLAEGQSSSYANPRFVEGGDLMALDQSGLRRWNIETGESELLYGGSIQKYAATADGRMALLVEAPTESDPGRAIYLDLETGATTPLEAHGDRVWAVGLDASGRIAVTADADGVVRVGAVSGEEPHLLFGHENRVMSVAIGPLGRWIASGGQDNTVRLWPMPDLSKPPLHTLPHNELIAKLKTLTNLRVVRDETSSTGWKLEVGPFPGWETVPTW
jgi:WD40 repeat protein